MPSTPLRTTEALLPLIALLVFFGLSMVVFGIRCATVGRPHTPYIQARPVSRLWKWWMEWWVWLWGPVERACIGLGITPNAITLTSTVFTGVAAGLLASGRLATGGWVYLLASSLDLVDGRVARAQGTASPAGAFLDSTLDRVSELLVFAGLAIFFRTSPTLYAALGAAAASVLVSYARARGEALGVTGEARVGGMQRAERVVLTGVPLALSPLCDAAFGPGSGVVVAGSALGVLAVVTSVTALRRSASIWRTLRGPVPGRDAAPRPFANVRWLDAARRRERAGR